MSSLPLVSVVIPYYDHGKHLHQTVHSCLRAYSGPLEIIIVNDGSIEAKATHYLEAARALSPAVKVLTQSNQGLSAARNAGVRAAKGAFVQLLDSDDMLTPGKLDLQVEHLSVQPKLAVSVSNYLVCDPAALDFRRDGDPMTRFDFSKRDFLLHWERGFSIPIHAALFRRDVLGAEPFSTALPGKEDWVFWCGLALDGHAMSYVPVYGAVYRQHAASMSKSFAKMSSAFLTASQMIEARLNGEEAAELRRASQEWNKTFYEPRIRDQQRKKPEAPAPPRPGNGVEASADNADWPALPACMTNEGRPRISVVVPVHNHYGYLRECLSSILAQTPSCGVEIVVVDDASSDPRVLPLLQSFAALNPRIKLILNKSNLGISDTQNRAAAAATGEFLAFLDCDDRLAENALSVVAEQLEGADYVFSDRIDVDAKGEKVRIAKYGGYDAIKPSSDIASDLLDGMVASHLKVIRREAFLAAGGFDPRLGGVQDWDLALKMAQRGARLSYIAQPLYLHRLHAGSVTGEDSVRQFWLSNVVRRRFASAALRPGLRDAQAIVAARRAVAAGAQETETVRVFKHAQRIGTKPLKEAWRAGKICLYIAGSGGDPAELNAVREFNSYFDAVFATEEGVASALIGYMWDHAALCLDGERL